MLPAAIRGEDGIRPGDQLEIDRVAPNEYRLRRIASSNAGLVDWLLACPEKGYFVPSSPSRRTASELAPARWLVDANVLPEPTKPGRCGPPSAATDR